MVEDIKGPNLILQDKQSEPYSDNKTQQVKLYCENEIKERSSPLFNLFAGIARTRC